MIQTAFKRLFHWLYNRIGSFALIRLTLLWLVLASISRGLTAIIAHLPVNWIFWTVFLGLLTGWALARTRLPGWGSGLAAAGIGLTWLTLTIGQIFVAIINLLPTFFPIIEQLIHHAAPDLGPMFAARAALIQDLVSLSNRCVFWLRGVWSGSPVTDPTATVLFWGLALWLVAIWAAWWVRRRNAIAVGLIPATILLAYNVFYTNSEKGIFWLALAGCGWVLLQSAQSYLLSQQRWQERRLDQAEIEPQLVTTIVVLMVGIMMAGTWLPSISIEKIRDTIQQIFQTRSDTALAESLGLQQTPNSNGTGGGSGGGGGGGVQQSPTHVVGPGPHLSQEVVLYISVDGYVDHRVSR